jgi:hypothetical protein
VNGVDKRKIEETDLKADADARGWAQEQGQEEYTEEFRLPRATKNELRMN